jgi:hypothetical protein
MHFLVVSISASFLSIGLDLGLNLQIPVPASHQTMSFVDTAKAAQDETQNDEKKSAEMFHHDVPLHIDDDQLLPIVHASPDSPKVDVKLTEQSEEFEEDLKPAEFKVGGAKVPEAKSVEKPDVTSEKLQKIIDEVLAENPKGKNVPVVEITVRDRRSQKMKVTMNVLVPFLRKHKTNEF